MLSAVVLSRSGQRPTCWLSRLGKALATLYEASKEKRQQQVLSAVVFPKSMDCNAVLPPTGGFQNRSVSPVDFGQEVATQDETTLEILFHDDADANAILGVEKSLIEKQLRELTDHAIFQSYPIDLIKVRAHFHRGKNGLPKSYLKQMRTSELTKRTKRVQKELRAAVLSCSAPNVIAEIKLRLVGLQWSLRNRDLQIEIECFLRHHNAAIAAFVVESDMNRGLVAVWTNKHRLVVVPVEEEYLSSLLSDLAVSSKKFCCDFQIIGKYDRRAEWENANFIKARCVGADGSSWEAQDRFGLNVVVTKEWFDDLLSMSDCDRARVVNAHRLALAEGKTKSDFVPLDEGCMKDKHSEAKPATSVRDSIHLRHQNLPGEFLCMVNCVASFLAHKGFEDVSESLMRIVKERANRLLAELNNSSAPIANPPSMLDMVREALRTHGIRLFLVPKKAKCMQGLIESSCKHPLLLSLMGKKNGVNHAVVVADGLLYDSNLSRVCDLSLAHLENSCGGSGYGGVAWARVIRFTARWRKNTRGSVIGDIAPAHV